MEFILGLVTVVVGLIVVNICAGIDRDTSSSFILDLVPGLMIALFGVFLLVLPVFNSHLYQHQVPHISYELRKEPKNKLWLNHNGIVHHYRAYNQPSNDILVKKTKFSWKYNSSIGQHLVSRNKHVTVKNTYYVPKNIKVIG